MNESSLKKQYPTINNLILQLIESGNAKINLNEFISKEGSNYFKNIAKRVPNWMPLYLGTFRRSFNDLKVNFMLQDINKIVLKRIPSLKLNSKVGVNKAGEGSLNAHKDAKDATLYFYTKEGNIQEKLPQKLIEQFVFLNVFVGIHKAIFPAVYVFGAERTGLTPFYLGLKVKTEIDATKGVDSNINIESQNIVSFPIVNLMTSIAEIQKNAIIANKRLDEAKKDKKIMKYIDLSDILEEQVLGGHLEFSTPKPDLTREILFKWKSDLILDISTSSSVVKSLTPLALHLRYNIKPNDLVIIDEPEMNLHPESQAKLIEFFCMLVNAGINVLITTHSPYIVDHLVNLMKASNYKEKEKIAEKFFLKNSDAFIPKEKVSVYLFDKDTALNVLGKEGMIDWDTFSKVSEEIAELYVNN